MEKEVKTTKTKVNLQVSSLEFLRFLNEFKLFLLEDLEIEPFTKFSSEFGQEYWYAKYHILRDGEIFLDYDEFLFLLNEKSLNIITLNITDKINFSLKCVDGDWFFEEFEGSNLPIINTIKNIIF